VKRLSNSSTQGAEELKNELALVAKLKHKNLVRLIGVCLEQQERLLVYEFVPNRSLDLVLFGTNRVMLNSNSSSKFSDHHTDHCLLCFLYGRCIQTLRMRNVSSWTGGRGTGS
jgi:hypothetical protein